MIGTYIEQYEKAVLEWFHAAYPPITHMVYAKDKESLEALNKTIEYPSLLYYRQDTDHVLPKALEYFEAEKQPNRATKYVMFTTVQPYEASLYLNDEADLYRVGNVLRQRWYQDSYVTMTYPDVNSKLRVGLYLKSFGFITERSGVDTKGPRRVLRMEWQSTLLLEAAYCEPRYTGFRLMLEPPNGDRITLLSTCKGDSCAIG